MRKESSLFYDTKKCFDKYLDLKWEVRAVWVRLFLRDQFSMQMLITGTWACYHNLFSIVATEWLKNRPNNVLPFHRNLLVYAVRSLSFCWLLRWPRLDTKLKGIRETLGKTLVFKINNFQVWFSAIRFEDFRSGSLFIQPWTLTTQSYSRTPSVSSTSNSFHLFQSLVKLVASFHLLVDLVVVVIIAWLDESPVWSSGTSRYCRKSNFSALLVPSVRWLKNFLG